MSALDLERLDPRWKPVARAVAERRADLGISQRRLAELAGVSHETVKRVERGVPCNFDSAVRMATTLRWRKSALFLIACGEDEDLEDQVERLSEQVTRLAEIVEGAKR